MTNQHSVSKEQGRNDNKRNMVSIYHVIDESNFVLPPYVIILLHSVDVRLVVPVSVREGIHAIG